VKAFAGNNDVSFGDVNLSEDRISGPPHNPGDGGWPTIRYFNKKTGEEGGTYVKKTSKGMCDELGDDEMMTAYIEEYGNTSTCSIKTGDGCDQKEKDYIEKVKTMSEDLVTTQLARLHAMAGQSMKPDLKSWMVKRKKILSQFAESKDEL